MSNYKISSVVLMLMLLAGITGCIGNETDPSPGATESSLSGQENMSPNMSLSQWGELIASAGPPCAVHRPG